MSSGYTGVLIYIGAPLFAEIIKGKEFSTIKAIWSKRFGFNGDVHVTLRVYARRRTTKFFKAIIGI